LIASSCWRSRKSLFHPLVDLGADLLAYGRIRKDILGPADEAREALLDIERLQHLELLLDAEVRRVAGKVGQVAGMANRSHRFDRAARAAQLEQVLDQGAVLASQLAGAVARLAVGQRLDLNPQCSADVGLAATEARAMQAFEDGDLGARRELTGLHDLRHGADGGKASVDMGHEQDQVVAFLRCSHGGPLWVALDGKRGGHAGQDDDVVQLQDRKEFGGQFSHVQSLCAGRREAIGSLVVGISIPPVRISEPTGRRLRAPILRAPAFVHERRMRG